jgi:hypothetical protein
VRGGNVTAWMWLDASNCSATNRLLCERCPAPVSQVPPDSSAPELSSATATLQTTHTAVEDPPHRPSPMCSPPTKGDPAIWPIPPTHREGPSSPAIEEAICSDSRGAPTPSHLPLPSTGGEHSASPATAGFPVSRSAAATISSMFHAACRCTLVVPLIPQTIAWLSVRSPHSSSMILAGHIVSPDDHAFARIRQL